MPEKNNILQLDALLNHLRAVVAKYESTSHVLVNVRVFDTAGPATPDGWEELISTVYNNDRHRLVINRIHKKAPIG